MNATLPDAITHIFGKPMLLTEREIVSIWRQDEKGRWYAIRFVQSRAAPV